MRAALILTAAALLACGSDSYGGSSSSDDGGDGGEASAFRIVIQGNAFSPLRLEVTPGATIQVTNLDAMPHSVTSQSAPGAYTPGGVASVSFDTGVFSSGQRTISIPANAPVGTEVPYYCTTHLGTMVTPNGTIAIVAVATGSSDPDPEPPPSGGDGGDPN